MCRKRETENKKMFERLVKQDTCIPRANQVFEPRKSISTLVPSCEQADQQLNLRGSLNIDQRARRLKGINQENQFLYKKLLEAPTSVNTYQLYQDSLIQQQRRQQCCRYLPNGKRKVDPVTAKMLK